jgi:methylphosphotriester-DNA--protein-cysteine methyltransferase
MKKRGVFVLVIVLIGLIAAAGYAASGDTTVYITKTGEKYHTERCTSVKNSKIAISLAAAVTRGFEACKRCKPPVLD